MFEETTIETTQAVEETTQAMEETTVVTEAAEETTIPEETNEIFETLGDVPIENLVLEDGSQTVEETVAMTTEPVYIDIIETSTSNIVHASLFGSFLICGTLVGIFLLRGRYGT